MRAAFNAVQHQSVMTRISPIKYPVQIIKTETKSIQKFIAQVKGDVAQLNALIDKYNGNILSDGTQSRDLINANKKSTLREIYEIRKKMDNKYSIEKISLVKPVTLTTH